MQTIVITAQTVKQHRDMMLTPKEVGLKFPSLIECFEDSKKITPKAVLYEQYTEKVGRLIPKIYFYMIMDQVYYSRGGKTPDGLLGYKLQLIK